MDQPQRPSQHRATKTRESPNERAAGPAEVHCTLWVHDESYSKNDVLINPSAFQPNAVVPGTALRILPVRSGPAVQDFEESSSSARQTTGQPAAKGRAAKNANEEPCSPRKAATASATGSGPGFVFVVSEGDLDRANKFANLQISVSLHIANLHGFKTRTNVSVQQVAQDAQAASHVEIAFRETHLTRDDMWRMAVSELTGKGIYEDQRLLYLGTIRATVRKIYVRGRRLPSAVFTDTSKPIFRSESARFILYIQMSKEMWEFDPQNPGETMFDQVVNGFLPRLFARWDRLNARHIVSIVLFTRMEYEEKPYQSAPDGSHIPSADLPRESYTKDFYRVVLSERPSVDSRQILIKLKKEFKTFLRDLSMHPWGVAGTDDGHDLVDKSQKPDAIVARPTTCIRGNILEAINLASLRFSTDFVDRDLVRTGVSIVVISPGTGVFEVEEQSLRFATENLANVAIGIDLVCLSQLPLHSVPLFMYRENNLYRPSGSTLGDASQFGTPGVQTVNGDTFSSTTLKDTLPHDDSQVWLDSSTGDWKFAIPHWIDISFWTRGSLLSNASNTAIAYRSPQDFVPRCRMYELQMMGLMEIEKSNISIPYLSEGAPYARQAPQKAYSHVLDDIYASSPESLNHWPHFGADPATRVHDPRKRTAAKDKVRETREEFQWMDDYDSRIFNASREPNETALRSSQWSGRPGSSQRRRHENAHAPNGSEAPSRLGHSSGTLSLSPRQSFLSRHMRDRDSHTVETSATQLRSHASDLSTGENAASSPKGRPRHPSLKLLGAQGKGSGKALASTNSTFDHAQSSRTTQKNDVDTEEAGDSGFRVSNSVKASLSRHATQASERSLKGTQPISIHKPTMDSAQVKSGDGDEESKGAQQGAFDSRNGSKRPVSSRAEADGQLLGPEHSSPRDLARSSSPPDILAPWLIIRNASNPRKNNQSVARQFRRWQNVFPRPPRASRLKWKSLCSPAALPLTGENRPSAEQLHEDFEESTYKILPNEDETSGGWHGHRTRLLKQLVGFRLARGFQVVPDIRTLHNPPAETSSAIFGRDYLGDDSAVVFMMRGSAVHLLCAAGSEVQVTRYDLKNTVTRAGQNIIYRPCIRTELSESYLPRSLTLKSIADEPNWNIIDNYLAGYDVSLTKALQAWRARFVLIPNEPPSSARRFNPVMAEDSDDEVYIEGVQRLTQLFEKSEAAAADSRGFHAAVSRRKDPNPLGLEFQTRDASAVVAAGLETTRLLEGAASVPPTQLFAGSEAYRTSSIDLHKLAQDLQGEKGIRIRDRRWYFRLHLNCFVGFDLTTWLLHNFKDVETREEAVDLGNILMKKGLFQHVHKKHVFRDGNFFYAITSEYRTARGDSQGWFSRKGDSKTSVPSTPLADKSKEATSADRPETRTGPDPARTGDRQSPASAKNTKPKVRLSEVLEYDVDHRKKSDRPEIIQVHYHKLYNPDSCYHFQIEWMNVTPKLVEDAIAAWSAAVERFGLRLIELPISESAGVRERHPFRDPYVIRLALPPPPTQPQTYFDNVSLGPQVSSDKFIYHRLLLRKFNFILDLEAASNFPADVEVTYSWGKPDYKYSQYIHKSGVLLVQIDDEGRFLLLANRLSTQWTGIAPPAKDVAKHDKSDLPFDRRPTSSMRSHKSASAADRPSPFTSPRVRAVADAHTSPTGKSLDDKDKSPQSAEQLIDGFEAFCRDAGALAEFYDHIAAPARSPSGKGTPAPTPTLEPHIPSLEIPPSIAGILSSGTSASRDTSTGRKSKTSAGSDA